MDNTCQACGKTMSSKSNLKRHVNTCSEIRKQMTNQIAQFELIKEETVNLRSKVGTLTEENALLREKIAYLEGQLVGAKTLQDHILEENKKPRTVNTTNIKAKNVNLAPYDLTRASVDAICREYTAEHFNQGPEATYRFILDKHLTDPDGTRRVACSDIARLIFKGVFEDGTEFIDVGGDKIYNEVVAPMRRAVQRAGMHYQEDKDISDDALEGRQRVHRRVLEPARIKKRLAGDLRAS